MYPVEIQGKDYLGEIRIHERLTELIKTRGKVEHEAVRSNSVWVYLHCPYFMVDVQSSREPVQNSISRLWRRPDQVVHNI
jgi:endonuclease IV